MKKEKAAGLLFTVLAALPLMLASCGGSGYKDGNYRAEAESYDQNGWKDYVSLTVSGGKVTGVEYDALSEEDGRKKSEDTDYQQKYRDAGLGTDPADYTTRLEDSYLERQKSGEVDAVSGATVSSERFRKMTEELEKAMKKGKTGTLKLNLE